MTTTVDTSNPDVSLEIDPSVVGDTTEDAVSISNGKLTCTTVLKPPVCQLDIPTNNNDGKYNTNETISYEIKQPAWDCTFSRDGIYLAVCYGAPNACIRIYHYCSSNSPIDPGTDDTCSIDGTSSQATWKNSNLRSATTVQQQQQYNKVITTKTYSWQLQSTLEGVHSRTIRSIDFAPISNPYIIASASFDGTIAIWEQQQQVIVHNESNEDEKKVNFNWECTTQLEGHENEVKCVTWNATGSLLASCGRDKTVWIWEAFLPGTIGGGPVLSKEVGYNPTSASSTNFECIAVLNGHEGDVKVVQFADSHDQFGDGNEILISASYDETIRIWAEEDGDWYCAMSLASIHTSTIWTIAIAPSATRFVSGSADHSLAIYKCFTPEELHQRDTKNGSSTSTKRKKATWECVGTLPGAHTSTVYCVDYAPTRASHGRMASCGADNRIQIYREVSMSTPEQPLFVIETNVIVPSGGDVNCVKWHPYDGSVLVSTSDDGSVRIWNYSV